MVKLELPAKKKLFMRDEKERILSQTDGFGAYTCDPHRGRHLSSALEALKDPDWVYRPEFLQTADRVFVKEYDSSPYAFTVVLVGAHDPKLLVPFTSFPVRRSGIRKWKSGDLIYAKNTTATD